MSGMIDYQLSSLAPTFGFEICITAGLVVSIAAHAVEEGDQPFGHVEGELCRLLEFGAHISAK